MDCNSFLSRQRFSSQSFQGISFFFPFSVFGKGKKIKKVRIASTDRADCTRKAHSKIVFEDLGAQHEKNKVQMTFPLKNRRKRNNSLVIHQSKA
jgi:hypothetical protein